MRLSHKIRGFMRKIIYTICIHSICWNHHHMPLRVVLKKTTDTAKGHLWFHNLFKRIAHLFCYESVSVVLWGF